MNIVPIKYCIGSPEDAIVPFIEYTGNGKWAVRYLGECMNTKGIWSYEPLPSSRNDDFIKENRFDSPEEALICYEKMGDIQV